MSKIVVIGAGPAGMIAAGTAAQNNDVILIEKNKILGKKLLITGKGRCNVTNNCDNNTFIQNMTKNSKFLYSAINNFSTKDTIDFFENLGVELKTERGFRVFPSSDKAKDIQLALIKFINDRNVKVINNTVKSITKVDDSFEIKLENNSITCDKVIIATGGLSYPLTGSTGDGYKFSKKLGHHIVDTMPSLVPLVSKDWFIKDLQGLSLKNSSIVVKNRDKTIYKDFGEMLFTHFGLSGPMILSASAHMRDFKNCEYIVYIDLKPALTDEVLDKRIQKDLLKFSNKDIINGLDELLPKSLIPIILKRSNIDERIKCNSITKEMRKELLNNIKSFSVSIDCARTIDEAIITSGGIDVKEVNPKTMESKIIEGLYFAGEVLDVDAYTGGFNLQIAFSTGVLAGENV